MNTATKNGKAAVIKNPKKPTTNLVDPAQIHDGLKMFDRWTGWRWKWNEKRKKWDKPPIDAIQGGFGSSTDPSKWCEFSKAINAQSEGRIDGIGFVLGEADGGVHFSGIDLDDCRDATSGKLTELATDIIEAMNTYCEVSPSGTGIKLLCIGSLPKGEKTANAAGTVEVYTGGRYFTITGQRIEGTPKRVEERQQKLESVWQKYIGSERKQPTKKSRKPSNAAGSDACEKALAVMLRMKVQENEIDGSKRLFACACRAVDHNLSDSEAIATVRKYATEKPFPVEWLDDEILQRIRDAEKTVDRGISLEFSNGVEYESDELDKDGNPKIKVAPLSMGEVLADLSSATKNWPRRIGNALFIDDKHHGIGWLEKQAALFGWVRSKRSVAWRVGNRMVSREELFSELARTAKHYDAVEVLPHEPPIRTHYYSCENPPATNGDALRNLLDRFRPETTVDRDLIQAAIMSTFWGGPPGSRPAFVITADKGRGVGKSKLAEIIAELSHGFVDVSAGEDIATLKQRFLSPEALTKRVAIIDNVKSMRFSWAELESLITTPTISGKRMYVGEAIRPNTLTWILTLNGVSLATDMAQRSVIIKLVRGKNDGTWYEDTIRFIDENRQELIGDITGALRAERFPLADYSRWAAWEKDILCRLPEPGEAQRLILERQGDADCEQDEAGIIEDFFADQLARFNYDPETAQVRIAVGTIAKWYCWATNDSCKTAAVTKRLKQMADEGHMKRISPDPSRTYGRCFIWTGKSADIHNQPISNDLQTRIEHYAKDR